MNPINSIILGFWAIVISLFFWDLLIKLVIQKKEVLLLSVQIAIFIYKILGKNGEISRIREENKITPDRKKEIFFFFASAISLSLYGFVDIIKGILVLLK